MEMDYKKKAIEKYCSFFNLKYEKLVVTDCDYKLNKEMSPYGYAQVIKVNSVIRMAYPLHVPVVDLSKVILKFLNPILIWSCDDGILYASIKDIYGTFRWTENQGIGDGMFMFLFKQKGVKYIKY